MKRLAVDPLTDDERAQLRLVLLNTTPAQRIVALEEMRLAFGKDHLRRSQTVKLQMQDLDRSLNFDPACDR